MVSDRASTAVQTEGQKKGGIIVLCTFHRILSSLRNRISPRWANSFRHLYKIRRTPAQVSTKNIAFTRAIALSLPKADPICSPAPIVLVDCIYYRLAKNMLDLYPKNLDLFLSCYYWLIRIYWAIWYGSILLELSGIYPLICGVDENISLRCSFEFCLA